MKEQNPWKRIFEQNPELTEKQGRDLQIEIRKLLEKRLEAELNKELNKEDKPKVDLD